MKIDDFKLERYFARYEFSVKYVLCASDCETFSVYDILSLEEGSMNKLSELRLSYTESAGSPELRNEVARLYENITPEDILIFTGAEEAIFIFMNVILNKGDNLIVQYPAYQSLYQLAESNDCEVRKWIMNSDDDWNLDIEQIKLMINPKTKAIVINFPHNPTGKMITKEEYKKIVEVARENNLYLFSDEVYKYLEFNSKDRLPSACDLYDNAVTLGVMSKAFGLAGLRIGWIATRNKELYNKIASMKDYTTICNSGPSEFLSEIALRNKDNLLKRNLDIINKNLLVLDKFFDNHNHIFDWIEPSGGSICFPQLINDVPADEFCKKLLQKEGILLIPSTIFDFGNSHFRIGFGRKDLPTIISLMDKYLNG